MNQSKKNSLFGTDGIRATFGDYPLDTESIVKLGNAVDRVFQGARIVIGRDTRQSGEQIMRLLSSGMSNQTKIFDCGIFPTPALSFVTDHDDFDYGIMITASHNPWTDNGIKIFRENGEKIPEFLEKDLEDIFFKINKPQSFERELVPVEAGARAFYRDFLLKVADQLEPAKRNRFKVVLDCANGAAFEEAPVIFEEAGFDTVTINHTPDGRNINQDCGSTHLDGLMQKVKELQADLGMAFDGDGDRVRMVDPEGNILDGDHMLFLIAKYLMETSGDFNKVVVGTVMGNLGLEKALEQMGVTYVRTPVGDKYVYEEMKKQQSILGGEQSGHTILRAFQKTGDGILTALYFLKALFHFNFSPTGVFRQLKLYPQVLKNIKIREKRDLEQWIGLNKMMNEFNQSHGKNSRVLIRYSGTEPLIRIMLESEDESVIHGNIGKFVNLIELTIGKKQ